MALAAHLDEAVPTSRDREPRRKVRLETSGTTAGGASTKVRIQDLSTTGLLLESPVPLAVGEKIEVGLPQAEGTSAEVVWTSGNLFGCQFDQAVLPAVLSAAQLQSSVDEVSISARETIEHEEAFAARLQRLRKGRGLTLSGLARELGVSKPTVWAWEQSKARPVESRIEALAAALGVPASELLSRGQRGLLPDLLSTAREKIADAFGTSPAKVRIMIEL